MNVVQLQQLRENRIGDESLNETWTRVQQDVSITPQEENFVPMIPDISYSEDLTIPRYKIIQPSCQIEGATPGLFLNTLTGEEVPKLEDVVFLVQQNSRSLFAEGDFSGAKKCWSYNGYTPAINQIVAKTDHEPQAPVCAKRENGKLVFCCPLAQWRNKAGEPDLNGTKPPVCKASIAFLGLQFQTQMPFWCVFHGAALPIVKTFLKIVHYKKEEARKQGKELQLYHFRLTIGLQVQTTAKGKYYIPVFEKKEEITDSEERAILRNAYAYLKDRFLSEPLEKSE